MDKSLEGCLPIFIGLIVVSLLGVFLAQDALQKRTQENQARIADANAQVALARAYEAQGIARAYEAQAQQELTAGQRAVMEAAGRAIDGQTEIVLRLADDYFPEPAFEYTDVLTGVGLGMVGAWLLTGMRERWETQRRKRQRERWDG